jgi:SMI1 / KNR4 family (SUKH-1)
MGIGGDWGIDSETGSAYLIAEWDYPDVGVVISSDGHTAFMLDYSKYGPDGEPRVIWVDTETGRGKPDLVVLAPDFGTFLTRLREPP